ncbi:hypothetical protein JTB14_021096 [Gonioctena quinquepunctata]|nr:hypothetical protein JTB14_021096 [Gonioctena quinquepunctata]
MREPPPFASVTNAPFLGEKNSIAIVLRSDQQIANFSPAVQRDKYFTFTDITPFPRLFQATDVTTLSEFILPCYLGAEADLFRFEFAHKKVPLLLGEWTEQPESK